MHLPLLTRTVSPEEWEEQYRPVVEYLMGQASLHTLRVRTGRTWNAGILTDSTALIERCQRTYPDASTDDPATAITAIVLTGHPDQETMARLKHLAGLEGLPEIAKAYHQKMTSTERAQFAALSADAQRDVLLWAPLVIEAPHVLVVTIVYPDHADCTFDLVALLNQYLPLPGSDQSCWPENRQTNPNL